MTTNVINKNGFEIYYSNYENKIEVAILKENTHYFSYVKTETEELIREKGEMGYKSILQISKEAEQYFTMCQYVLPYVV